MGQKGRAEVNFPSSGFDRHDSPQDQVADFGTVPCAEGVDAEEFVGADEGAGYGGVDLGGRGMRCVGAVATGVLRSV